MVTAAQPQTVEISTPPLRHSFLVRVTHWLNLASFIGLAISGWEILLAHPRMYWGETGAVGMPSLFDLPLQFKLTGQTGWGRSLHFQSAWLFVLTGVVYVISGVASRHFQRDLVPAARDLSLRNLTKVARDHMFLKRFGWEYNVLQRLSYLGVVFVIAPVMVLTGLAMSPSFVAAFPFVVTMFGGHQAARTIHFFASAALVIFVLVHVAMITLAGFWQRLRSMIVGKESA